MYVRSHRLWTLDLRAVPWRRARLVAKEGYLLPVPPFNNDDVVCLLARFVDGPVRPGLVTTRLPWAGGEQTNGRQTIRQTSKRRTITYHPKHTRSPFSSVSSFCVMLFPASPGPRNREKTKSSTSLLLSVTLVLSRLRSLLSCPILSSAARPVCLPALSGGPVHYSHCTFFTVLATLFRCSHWPALAWSVLTD